MTIENEVCCPICYEPINGEHDCSPPAPEPVVISCDTVSARFSDGMTTVARGSVNRAFGYLQILEPGVFLDVFTIGRTKTEVQAALIAPKQDGAPGRPIPSPSVTDKHFHPTAEAALREGRKKPIK